MCSSEQSSVNSYALNGLCDWQQQCCSVFLLGRVVRRFRFILYERNVSLRGLKVRRVEESPWVQPLSKANWRLKPLTSENKDVFRSVKRVNRLELRMCAEIVVLTLWSLFAPRRGFFFYQTVMGKKNNTFTVCLSLIGRKLLTRPVWHCITRCCVIAWISVGYCVQSAQFKLALTRLGIATLWPRCDRTTTWQWQRFGVINEPRTVFTAALSLCTRCPQC